jgi:hypothetical protein
MDVFTAHDRHHALKVAHIMAFIIRHERFILLTPPEIALLVLAAYVHDLGMGLGPEEREARLAPNSDLWLKTDLHRAFRSRMLELSETIRDSRATEQERVIAARKVHQAEEALLCADSRERHATQERYDELLATVTELAERSVGKISFPDELLSYAGDSLRRDLINVCISHNQSPYFLLERSPENVDEPLFPADAPFLGCTADVRFVAGVLRIADIMDFDRERTPQALFHYLLPHDADAATNISVREWSKHLAVTSWEISDSGDILYRASCSDPVIHHAIVLFVEDIRHEVAQTLSVLGETFSSSIILSGSAHSAIRSEGYRYLPYQFRLDEERVYSLLMGGQIYDTPLAALRELIQNAVDACGLKDAIIRKADPSYHASRSNRITLRFRSGADPSVSVLDTGIGMDRNVIENYLLCVGRSYYRSVEYSRLSAELRSNGLDFSPVSEFGIGFLSCFLLGPKVEVETNPLPRVGHEAKKMTMQIDGLTRLIHVKEMPADPLRVGTRVTIFLSSAEKTSINWGDVDQYVRQVCRNLPYDLLLEKWSDDGLQEQEVLEPSVQDITPPEHLRVAAVIIDFSDEQLKGRVILFAEQASIDIAKRETAGSFIISDELESQPENVLLRGGFVVSSVPGLPTSYLYGASPLAKVELANREVDNDNWRTNLARTSLASSKPVADAVQRHVLSHIIAGGTGIMRLGKHDLDGSVPLRECLWLEDFDAAQIYDSAMHMWGEDRKVRDAVAKWEEGKARLRFGMIGREVHANLLDLVLPAVSSVFINTDGARYLCPLGGEWRTSLEGWRTFISDPVPWDKFAEYAATLSDTIYCYQYEGRTNVLNSRYRDLMTDFPFQMNQLTAIFHRLLAGSRYGQPVRLTSSSVEMLTWLTSNDPEALIRSRERTILLASLFD